MITYPATPNYIVPDMSYIQKDIRKARDISSAIGHAAAELCLT
jgi:hypothetical protein